VLLLKEDALDGPESCPFGILAGLRPIQYRPVPPCTKLLGHNSVAVGEYRWRFDLNG